MAALPRILKFTEEQQTLKLIEGDSSNEGHASFISRIELVIEIIVSGMRVKYPSHTFSLKTASVMVIILLVLTKYIQLLLMLARKLLLW